MASRDEILLVFLIVNFMTAFIMSADDLLPNVPNPFDEFKSANILFPVQTNPGGSYAGTQPSVNNTQVQQARAVSTVCGGSLIGSVITGAVLGTVIASPGLGTLLGAGAGFFAGLTACTFAERNPQVASNFVNTVEQTLPIVKSVDDFAAAAGKYLIFIAVTINFIIDMQFFGVSVFLYDPTIGFILMPFSLITNIWFGTYAIDVIRGIGG